MKEHTSHIKNPLTVISRFAAVAEVCGSVVLPFIAPDNQSMYIWFLILFPTFIVTLFFATLNFNHKTLYAPSDYKNEDHFISLFGKVTMAERIEKLQEEVDEAIPGPETESPLDPCVTVTDTPSAYKGSASDHGEDGEDGEDGDTLDRRPKNDSLTNQNPDELPNPHAPLNDPPKTPLPEKKQEEENKFDFKEFAKYHKEQLISKIKNIEALAIHKLSSETNATFLPEVKFDFPGLMVPLIFDGIANTNEAVHIAEVKYFKSAYTIRRFADTFKKANFAAQNIKRVSDKKTYLHIVIVFDEAVVSVNTFNIKKQIKEFCDQYEFIPVVHTTTLDDVKDIDKPLDSWYFTLKVN